MLPKNALKYHFPAMGVDKIDWIVYNTSIKSTIIAKVPYISQNHLQKSVSVRY